MRMPVEAPPTAGTAAVRNGRCVPYACLAATVDLRCTLYRDVLRTGEHRAIGSQNDDKAQAQAATKCKKGFLKKKANA